MILSTWIVHSAEKYQYSIEEGRVEPIGRIVWVDQEGGEIEKLGGLEKSDKYEASIALHGVW